MLVKETAPIKFEIPASLAKALDVYEELEGKRKRIALEAKAEAAYAKTLKVALDGDEEIQSRITEPIKAATGKPKREARTATVAA